MSDQRMQLIVRCQEQEESMAELCRQFQVSRKTAYKWLARWRAEGVAGLQDRSRAARNHPNQVPPEWVQKILQIRDCYRWGPKKIRVLLQREDSRIHWPSLSTIEEILRTHGRMVPRKKRRRVPPQTRPLAHATGPNAVWCADFKGEFLLGQGDYCYPLTITDAFSRFLLRCQGLAQTGYESVRPIFEWAFREYGLPQAIRSDNGPPFASRAVAGLSRLSLWWIKLGIVPDRIQAGHPEQNGRHERMHGTLGPETASPPASTFRRQQKRFDEFREKFNSVRPHEAMQMQTPGSVYESSPRAYPPKEPEVVYPSGWAVRRVQKRGEFSWQKGPVILSEVLYGETIGLEPVDGRYWRVYFGPVWLGAFDGHHRKMLSLAEVRRPRQDRPDLAPAPRATEDRPSAALQDDPL